MYVTTDPQLSGIFSKIGKGLKKVLKASTQLSLSHQLVKKAAPKLYNATAGKVIGPVSSSPKTPPASIPAPIPDVAAAPAVTAPPPTAIATPFPGAAPVAPSVAPPPAAVSTAVIPTASMFGPANDMTPANFGPAEADATPAAPASDSKMPLILGAAALGALFLIMRKKRS